MAQVRPDEVSAILKEQLAGVSSETELEEVCLLYTSDAADD